jgi:hypothetical protein
VCSSPHSFRLAVFHSGRRGGWVLFPRAEPGVDVGGSEAPAGVQTDRTRQFACAGAAVDSVTATTKPGCQLIGGDEIAGCLLEHDYSVTRSVTMGNGRKMGT